MGTRVHQHHATQIQYRDLSGAHAGNKSDSLRQELPESLKGTPGKSKDLAIFSVDIIYPTSGVHLGRAHINMMHSEDNRTESKN